MILASAQIKPIPHDTNANISNHLRLIEEAAKQGVKLLLFPEMSLTGYEREFAAELAFSENDIRLTPIKEKSVLHAMMIVVGAPIRIESNLHIGIFIFTPDSKVSIYTKQFLHGEEKLFFTANNYFNPVLEFEQERISVGICADITHEQHFINAHKQNTSLYLASIFYTPSGIPEAYQQLGSYAKKYSMNILMANYGGPSYRFESGGQSAFWNSNGTLINSSTSATEELLIVNTDKNKPTKQTP